MLDSLEREALNFRELWNRGTDKARQRVARAVIQRVEISSDRTTAAWDYLTVPMGVYKTECPGLKGPGLYTLVGSSRGTGSPILHIPILFPPHTSIQNLVA